MSVTLGAVLGGIATGLSAASPLIDTAVNYKLIKDTNAQNEALMRESWAREDNAVQRRVADLKAAGLSPTLAAGSAAASSAPITLKSPKIETSAAVQNAMQTAAAVKQLKNMELTNENLKKQGEILDLNKEYYGYPDWAVAGIRMFGLEGFKDMIRQIGGQFFDGLFGGSGTSTPSETSPSSVPLSDSKLDKAVDTQGSSIGLSQEEMNGAVKQGLENAGIETTKPKIESNGSSYGVTNDEFEKAAKSFVQTMLNDNMASTSNLDLLAHQLSVRYSLVESDVRKYLTDLVRELRKH